LRHGHCPERRASCQNYRAEPGRQKGRCRCRTWLCRWAAGCSRRRSLRAGRPDDSCPARQGRSLPPGASSVGGSEGARRVAWGPWVLPLFSRSRAERELHLVTAEGAFGMARDDVSVIMGGIGEDPVEIGAAEERVNVVVIEDGHILLE